MSFQNLEFRFYWINLVFFPIFSSRIVGFLITFATFAT